MTTRPSLSQRARSGSACRICWGTGQCPCGVEPVSAAHLRAELRGLRELARAVERHGDPVSARMARNALEGVYPEREAA